MSRMTIEFNPRDAQSIKNAIATLEYMAECQRKWRPAIRMGEPESPKKKKGASE